MKNYRLLFTLLACLSITVACAPQRAATVLQPSQPQQRVENVILMIGDGMGLAHITQHIVKNDLKRVEIERAQAVGLMKTFSANNRVTDSAAGGTAIATGTKTNNGTVGRGPDGRDLTSILVNAQRAGYPTGLVVTVDLFDATPGAFYGHVTSRKSRDTIAVQLLDAGIDVAIGGGREYLDERKDGRVLTDEFRAKGYNVVFDLQQAQGVAQGKLLAPLAPKTMSYSIKGRGDYLPRATTKAIEILANNRKANGSRGFFLMVEGSMIDYAAHDNLPDELAGEVADFNAAVKVAFDYADRNPGTLVVVAADHETGGFTLPSNEADFTQADSGVAYKFSTGGHSASLVPIYAYGTGAQNFSRVIDNTELSGIIARLMGVDMK